MKVTAYWTVTEDHSAEIEVPDHLADEDVRDWVAGELAEYENNDSYFCTSDRSLESIEPRDDRPAGFEDCSCDTSGHTEPCLKASGG